MTSWFANMRYSRKMLLTIGIIIIAGLMPFAMGLRSLLTTRDALHKTSIEGQEISNLHQAQTDLLRMHIAEDAFFLNRAPADLETSQKLAASVDLALDELAEVADSPDEVEEARSARQAVAANHQLFLQLVARTADGSPNRMAAAEMVQRHADVSEQLRTLVEEARAEIDEALREAGQKADDDTRTTLVLGIGLAAASMILGIIMSLLLARGITRPITELRNVAEKISMGETSVKVTTGRKDEIGQLADAFDRMVTAVRFLAMEVAEHEEAQKQKET